MTGFLSIYIVLFQLDPHWFPRRSKFMKISVEILLFVNVVTLICANNISFWDCFIHYLLPMPCSIAYLYFMTFNYIMILYPAQNVLAHSMLIYHLVRGVSEIISYIFYSKREINRRKYFFQNKITAKYTAIYLYRWIDLAVCFNIYFSPVRARFQRYMLHTYVFIVHQ